MDVFGFVISVDSEGAKLRSSNEVRTGFAYSVSVTKCVAALRPGRDWMERLAGKISGINGPVQDGVDRNGKECAS